MFKKELHCFGVDKLGTCHSETICGNACKDRLAMHALLSHALHTNGFQKLNGIRSYLTPRRTQMMLKQQHLKYIDNDNRQASDDPLKV